MDQGNKFPVKSFALTNKSPGSNIPASPRKQVPLLKGVCIWIAAFSVPKQCEVHRFFIGCFVANKRKIHPLLRGALDFPSCSAIALVHVPSGAAEPVLGAADLEPDLVALVVGNANDAVLTIRPEQSTER
mmetsp:Transcript_16709/g.33388  ORF Transcript_16709/g.33388 Transcript_16709/m.33388 type:complete len:130 (+) Transcript_16709:548-937(+)